MRYREISEALLEIALTGSHSFHWEQRGEKRWDGFVDVGERQIGITFTRTSGTGRQSAWRVDFLRRTYPEARGTTQETVSILNAVVTAIGEFLDTIQPERLQMSPTGKSREKLYRAVLQRMMPKISHAYMLDERWYGTLFGEFELTRKPEWLYGGWIAEAQNTYSPQSAQELVVWGESIGVHASVFEKADEIELSNIERGKDTPKGRGAEFMRALCAYADGKRKPVYLATVGWDDTLPKYYRQFGFVRIGPRNDETGDMAMVRRPRRIVKESAETDYPTFEAEWAEYVMDLLANHAEDRREVTFEWYDQVRQELEHNFSRHEFMYRTIHVAPAWVEQLGRNQGQPLGVHWSVSHLDWQPSSSPYDQRFSYPSGKTVTVRMTARVPPYQAIDWNASIASAMATSEDELRVRESAMIELVAVSVDGYDTPLSLTRPA